MVIGLDGSLKASDIYRAMSAIMQNSRIIVLRVLEGKEIVPEAITAVNGLADNLLMQDKVAQSMKSLRHTHGALSLETIETKPIFKGDEIRDFEEEKKNRAKDIIEDFMIGANGVTARYLSSKKIPSIRRVVRTRKDGNELSNLLMNMGSSFLMIRTQKRWTSF